MKMIMFRTWTALLALTVSGCASVHESLPPKLGTGAAPSVALSPDMPKADFLPEQSAIAPGTKYVMVQPGGGSLLLGPILGSLNIAANTREMAEKYKNSVLGIDPKAFAQNALAQEGLTGSNGSALIIKPFIFVQHCYDEKFRLSLVFHVESTVAGNPWVGRYISHLPTSYSVQGFDKLSAAEIANYRTELEKGSVEAAKLLRRDVTGALPATGKKVAFGSLYLTGNKIGGGVFYTMPEELHFPNSELIEEADGDVIVCIKGNIHATGLIGGMAFGVHQIDRKLVHTLKPVQAN